VGFLHHLLDLGLLGRPTAAGHRQPGAQLGGSLLNLLV